MSEGAPYDRIGRAYARTRRTDPTIARAIVDALGSATTVANVGAGTGSYEPPGRTVVALDPSWTMLAQRPAVAPSAVLARAEALPLAEASVDAAMAILTLQHWSSPAAGLAELRRIARTRIVVLTWDPASCGTYWLASDYFPEIERRDLERFPTIEWILARLGGGEALTVPIPSECTDGFCGAFWARPEAFLDPAIRDGISAFAAIGSEATARGLERLSRDLQTGAWDRRYGHLPRRDDLDIGYRLVVWPSP